MLKRTHKCGEPRVGDVGREVVLSGWVANWRDHGGLVFIDLRDRTGIAQVVFRPERDASLHARARDLRSEFCISVRGRVEHRPEGMENPELPTGQVEVLAEELEVHSLSETPPFDVQGTAEVGMETRLRYRYLDLRRPQMQRNLEFRHRLLQLTRRYLDEQGFLEIETPFLTKSTPEGARDYLVPSRINPGCFYALPQSPQLFKQILMMSGMDRYFQIVRCFRDEDLRANRQPEFTQIDCEMSFADEEDVQGVAEGLMARAFEQLLGRTLPLPLPRMRYEDAMARYGSDKPDLRFGLEIRDVSDVAAKCAFRVFSDAVAEGGQVRGLCIPGGGQMPRSQVDGLVQMAKDLGASGLAWYKTKEGPGASGGGAEGGIAKFLTEAEQAAVAERFEAKGGALLIFVAGRRYICNLVLSHMRLHLGKEMGLLRDAKDALCWITDPPAFEVDEETGKLTFVHHPFTSPAEEDVDRLESDPTACHARGYDLVMNGQEVGGGSIRIARPDLQMRIFKILGYTEEQMEQRFGFFINALRYGPPPHGGIAFGFDRLVMTLMGIDDIREVIAFPKTQRAVCVLTEAPTRVDDAQLKELGIALREE